MESNPYIEALGIVLLLAAGIYAIAARKWIRRREVKSYRRWPNLHRPFFIYSKKAYYANAIICGSGFILMAGILAYFLLRRFL